MQRKVFRLFTDGACRGNPGVGGAGAVITDDGGRVVWRSNEYFERCTNNIAEYKALILGLKGARQCGCRHLEIFMDSELLVKQINGSYQVKNENLKTLMKEVRELLSGFDCTVVKHVPRSHNAQADRLANMAIDGEKITS